MPIAYVRNPRRRIMPRVYKKGSRMARQWLYKRKRMTRRRPAGNRLRLNRWVVSQLTTGFGPQIKIAAGAQQGYYATDFCLNDLPDSNDFTAIFDMYRIRKVTAYVRLLTNPDATNEPNTGNTLKSNFFPDVYMAVDHDDAQVPSSIIGIISYDKCKTAVAKPNSWIKYPMYPTPVEVVRDADAGSTSAVKVGRNGTWFNCSKPTVPHYAFKIALSTGALGANLVNDMYFEVKWRYQLEFKNQY